MALLSRICRSAALLALVACGVGACGGGSTGSGPGGNIGAPPTGSGSNGISSGSASTGASGSATSAPNISGSAGSGAARSMDAGDVEAGHPVDAGGGDSSMAPFTGPINGDPNKPMVAVPSVPCGVPNLGLGQSPATVKITNRDVVVVYPCKHEGAAVTFFLFLHGTLNDPQKVSFTMNAFSIHKLVDSHNVIVVVPKAIGTQWGNGDNGQDLPHLYDVVDWVYATFGQKFSIRSMWSQGGSGLHVRVRSEASGSTSRRSASRRRWMSSLLRPPLLHRHSANAAARQRDGPDGGASGDILYAVQYPTVCNKARLQSEDRPRDDRERPGMDLGELQPGLGSFLLARPWKPPRHVG
jgi:hypothetical protein